MAPIIWNVTSLWAVRTVAYLNERIHKKKQKNTHLAPPSCLITMKCFEPENCLFSFVEFFWSITLLRSSLIGFFLVWKFLTISGTSGVMSAFWRRSNRTQCFMFVLMSLNFCGEVSSLTCFIGRESYQQWFHCWYFPSFFLYFYSPVSDFHFNSTTVKAIKMSGLQNCITW